MHYPISSEDAEDWACAIKDELAGLDSPPPPVWARLLNRKSFDVMLKKWRGRGGGSMGYSNAAEDQGNSGPAWCPLLTASAIEALEAHGSEPLKKTYLAKLISGEWTGTMQLTEPQAGSDVGALRTRAERAGDGIREQPLQLFEVLLLYMKI